VYQFEDLAVITRHSDTSMPPLAAMYRVQIPGFLSKFLFFLRIISHHN
jgi:hypothetical protein